MCTVLRCCINNRCHQLVNAVVSIELKYMNHQLSVLYTLKNYTDGVCVLFFIQHDGSSASQPKSMSSRCSQQTTAGDCEADKVRKKISPMFQTSSKKTKVGPVLEALQNLSDEDLNADDVCKRLEDLALEQKFTVTYLDLPEISLSGNFLLSVTSCLMQIAIVHFLCSYILHLIKHNSLGSVLTRRYTDMCFLLPATVCHHPDTHPIDVTSQRLDDWTSASVVICFLVDGPTIWQPGFDLSSLWMAQLSGNQNSICHDNTGQK